MVKRRPRPNKKAARPRPNKKAAQVKAEVAADAAAVKDRHRPTARDLEIYEQYCEGEKSVRDLAAEYKISKSRISEICRAVETWLASQLIMEIRQLRVRVTHRLETIYFKSMRGFEESRRDEVTQTTTTCGEGGPKRTKQRRGQAGAPAFLAQAREAMRDLRELWGTDAPVKVSHEINAAVRIGGRDPQEAARIRRDYLEKMLTPNDN